VTVREEFQHPPPVSSYQQATLAGGNSESFRVSPRRAGYLQVRLIPAEQYGGAVQEAALRPPTGPDDESLVIENVLIGSYRVRCYTSWGYGASATSENVNVLRQPLIVASGAAPDPIEITLRDDSAEVSGTVESLAKVASQDKGLLSQRSTTSLTAAFPRRITFSRSPTVHFIPLPEGSGTFSVVPVSPDGKFQFNQ